MAVANYDKGSAPHYVAFRVNVKNGGKYNLAGLLPIIFLLSAIYAVSYSLWTVLLKHHPASKVAIHSFMTPVFGVIFSAFLLQEDGGVPISNLIIALTLVCLGIILWGYTKKGKEE